MVGYAVDFEDPAAPRLWLGYRCLPAGEDVRYALPLVSTPCRFGGARWWFVCPLAAPGGRACGRRARKVYLRGLYFGCRRCHGLTYKSCQTHNKRVAALLRSGADLDAFWVGGGLPAACLALAALTRRLDRLRGPRERPTLAGSPAGSG